MPPNAVPGWYFAHSFLGSSSWAARVLRPGGRLVFLVNGVLVMLCAGPEDTEDIPVTACFKRPYFGMHRFEWPDDDSVECHLGHCSGRGP